MTIGNVTALKSTVPRTTVQHAPTIGIRAGVKHVAPMGPSYGGGNAADCRSYDDEGIQEGERTFGAVRHGAVVVVVARSCY